MDGVIDESLIKIRDLTATVKLNNGEILTTVSNAHLELKRGHSYAIVGKSGSGKTPLRDAPSEVLKFLSNNCSCEGSLVFLSFINSPNSFKFPSFLSLNLLSKLIDNPLLFAIYFAVAFALV